MKGDDRRSEPCSGCGDETGAGSILYSDRRSFDLETGGRAYLCSYCVQRASAARRGRPLTDAEARRLLDNGSMAMIRLGGGPPGF